MKRIVVVLSLCMAAMPLSAVEIVPNPVYKAETGKYVSARCSSRVRTELSDALQSEEYHLTISRKGVRITGGSERALTWGMQTLEQIKAQSPSGKLPCLEIKDAPAFAYRGLLVDCARHFVSVQDLKSIMDMMALHKLNKLHWHLTDDQGWRLELKCYPELTTIGSVRAQTKIGHYSDRTQGYDGTPYGGYYTADDVREVLDYAASRSIDVIPEIEMPGHSQAALAALPWLGCRGGGYEVRQTWAISNEILCVGRESTFDFIFKVLDEVCEMFPGEYINIGGDEVRPDEWRACPHCQAFMREHGMSTEMELQRYLVGRVESYLASKGRKMIGWGEIFEGCKLPSTIVLSWRGSETGIKASLKGMKSVMCPGSQGLYLDYYQTPERDKREPVAIHYDRYTDLQKTYSYNPLEGIPQDRQSYVQGVQACAWGEYIADLNHFQHMVLPRLAAAAETAWSGPEHKTPYPAFKARLISALLPVYDARGYNYATYEFEKK